MILEQHALHIPKPDPVLPRKKKRGRYVYGVSLILLGLFFSIKNAGLIEISWPLILMVTGVASLVETWMKRRTGGVFPGIFLILLGLVFLADNQSWIEGGVGRNWPLVILALSLSLICASLFVRDRRRQWSSGILLLIVSSILLVLEYDCIHWVGLSAALNWWPVILIIAGGWMFIRKTKLIDKSHE